MATATALSASYQQQSEKRLLEEATVIAENFGEKVIAMPYTRPTVTGKLVADPSMGDAWLARFPSINADSTSTDAMVTLSNDASTISERADVVRGNQGDYVRRVAVDAAGLVNGFNNMAHTIGVVTVEVVTPTGESVVVRRLLVPTREQA